MNASKYILILIYDFEAMNRNFISNYFFIRTSSLFLSNIKITILFPRVKNLLAKDLLLRIRRNHYERITRDHYIPEKFRNGLAAWKQRHVADSYHSVLLSLTTLFGYRSFRAKLCEYSRSSHRPDGIRTLGTRWRNISGWISRRRRIGDRAAPPHRIELEKKCSRINPFFLLLSFVKFMDKLSLIFTSSNIKNIKKRLSVKL